MLQHPNEEPPVNDSNERCMYGQVGVYGGAATCVPQSTYTKAKQRKSIEIYDLQRQKPRHFFMSYILDP
ncbi:uncharacterized [Tachysurus ichikawai]